MLLDNWLKKNIAWLKSFWREPGSLFRGLFLPLFFPFVTKKTVSQEYYSSEFPVFLLWMSFLPSVQDKDLYLLSRCQQQRWSSAARGKNVLPSRSSIRTLFLQSAKQLVWRCCAFKCVRFGVEFFLLNYSWSHKTNLTSSSACKFSST